MRSNVANAAPISATVGLAGISTGLVDLEQEGWAGCTSRTCWILAGRP